jgi:hypothetical protein
MTHGDFRRVACHAELGAVPSQNPHRLIVPETDGEGQSLPFRALCRVKQEVKNETGPD